MMQTGVSSEVVPAASLAELLTGATRHGLSVLELRAGDGHGVSASVALEADALARVLDLMRGSPVTISSYRDNGTESAHELVMLARALSASILIDGAESLAKKLSRAQQLRSEDDGIAAGNAAGSAADDAAGIAVVVRGIDAVADALAITRAGHAVSWDARPSDEQLGTQAAAMLNACGDALCQVRIAGGGPESTLHEGRGIGALMARLALAGYAGTVIIAPSSPSYHLLWEQWLGKRPGWGCGSHASDPSLVTLELPAPIGGAI